MIKKLLLILPFLLLTESAFACSCGKVSLEDRVKEAKYIYIGVVIQSKTNLPNRSYTQFYKERKRLYSDNPPYVPNITVSSWVDVIDYIKGRAPASWIQTSLYSDGRSCRGAGTPAVGTIAVIVAYKDSVQSIGKCNRASKFFHASDMKKATKYAKKLKAILKKQAK